MPALNGTYAWSTHLIWRMVQLPFLFSASTKIDSSKSAFSRSVKKDLKSVAYKLMHVKLISSINCSVNESVAFGQTTIGQKDVSSHLKLLEWEGKRNNQTP